MHRLIARAALVALALGALVISLPACSGGTKAQHEVWVIGLDGGDWDIIGPVIDAGHMPNLKKLRDEGAWGRLRSEQPLLSPVLWTSIATGRTPDKHGVTWFMSTTPDGQKIPISSRSRQVRAIWDIASENKLKTGVIGWWATWPVEPINGFMVSDYVGWHSFGITGRGVDDAGKVWPESYAQDVATLLPAPESIANEQLKRIVHLPDDKLNAANASTAGPYSNPISHLRQAMATARGYTNIALDRLAKDRPQFLGVYYEGTDAAMHLFNNFAPPKQAWVSDGDYEAYKDAVANYFAWQDGLIGELLAKRGPNTTIVICSDHGYRTGDERLKEEQVDIELADASHMIDGIVVLNGPGVRAGAQITGAGVYDIAPTVAQLLDLPVAGDLNGKVLAGALTSEFRTQHPEKQVATWETTPLQHSGQVVNDPQAAARMEEMLRSLGYVAGANNTGAAASPGVAVGAENAVNLATIYMRQGKLADAVKVLEAEYARSPKDKMVRLNLAQALARSGRGNDALKLYRELRRDEPRDLAVVEDYAHALMGAGQFTHAVAVYDSGLVVDPKWAWGLAGKGYALHRMGRSQEGAQLVTQAQQLDGRMARAYFYAGIIALETGNRAVAKPQLTRALELDPTDAQSALALSSLLLDANDVPGARGVLERTLSAAGAAPELEGQLGFVLLQARQPAEAVPHLKAASDARAAAGQADPMLMGNLGVAQAMSNDLDGGIATFRRMTQLWPDNADAHGQLGGFLAQAGRREDAIRELERAVQLAPGNQRFKQILAQVRGQ